MKYLTFIFTLLFTGLLNLFSQSKFMDGYIITNENDTIHGFIDPGADKDNSLRCRFSLDENSEIQEFTPEGIKAYRYTESKYYISRSVETLDGEKQLFLEFLIDGVVDILYSWDGMGEHYYADDGKGNLIELMHDSKEIKIDDKKYVQSDKYKFQLKAIFNESPAIHLKLDDVSFNRKSLVKIAQDYHNDVCSDKECIDYTKNFPKTRITIKTNYGLCVGLNVFSYHPSDELSDDYYYLKDNPFGIKIFPSIGFFYKINFPELNEKLYMQLEGTYSRTEVSYSDSILWVNYTYVDDISMITNTFNTSGMFKYEFPSGQFRPTFQIGGFANYSLKADYYHHQIVYSSYGNIVLDDIKTVTPDWGLLYLGLNVGFGIKTFVFNDREMFFDFRYQRGIGFVKGVNTNNFLLNMGFQIGE